MNRRRLTADLLDSLGASALTVAIFTAVGLAAWSAFSPSRHVSAWHDSPDPVAASSAAVRSAATGLAPGRVYAHASTGVPDAVVSAQARRSCPPSATACVDLSDHLTWLQRRDRIAYGPVPMEWARAERRGTYRVLRKTRGCVFFGSGAAFQTTAAPGDVRLRAADARYYQQHLMIGARVVVF